MQNIEKNNENSEKKEYFVFILTDSERKALYTGFTNDILKRMEGFRSGMDKGKYVARYGGVNNLIYCEKIYGIDEALARKKLIKGWKREKKINLIESLNPNWEFLDETLYL